MNDQRLQQLYSRLSENMAAVSIATERKTINLLYHEIDCIRQAMATEYATRHGWKFVNDRPVQYVNSKVITDADIFRKDAVILGGRTFTEKALRERKRYAYERGEPRGGFSGFDSSYMDHSYFFKHPDGTAAAIVSHPYGIPRDLATWAAGNGLTARTPSFPTWWNPGRTHLVEYTTMSAPAPKVKETFSIPESTKFRVYKSRSDADRHMNEWARECESKNSPCVYVRPLSKFWMVGWLHMNPGRGYEIKRSESLTTALIEIRNRYWKLRRAPHGVEEITGVMSRLTFDEAIEAARDIYDAMESHKSGVGV